MASTEFHALQAQIAAQPAPPPVDLPERRRLIDARLGSVPLAPGTSATEVSLAGVPVWRCTRDDGGDGDPVVLYLHGGGYRIGSALAWRAFATHLARAASVRVDVLDYRLAPEHPYPAALDDTVAAYTALLADGVPPGRLFVAGDSAGGGLAAATLAALAARGLPQPAGAICLSPWADLRNTARSFTVNAALDTLFGHAQAEEAAATYLAGQDPTDPFASPVLARWEGAAPMLVQVGDRETLLDDAVELTYVARAAGVDVVLEVWAEMPHVWQISYPAFPEAVQAVDHIAAFVAAHVAAA